MNKHRQTLSNEELEIERLEFHKWANFYCHCIDRNWDFDGDYKSVTTHDLWESWQSAVASYKGRLAKQEPVAWFTEDHLTDRSATTYDPVVRDRWIAKGWPISLLYTHPCDSQIPDGTLIGEGTKNHTVRCNGCWWHGKEDDLVLAVAADYPDDDPAKVCPNCKKIGCLMDLDHNEQQVDLAKEQHGAINNHIPSVGKMVLSNDELLEVFVSKKGSSDYSALDVMRWAQDAVLAKLAEREPFAWFIDDKRVCGNGSITDPAIAKDWLETDPDKVTPLCAHPHPEMQKPFTPRNAAEMRDFVGMHFGSLRYANPETEEPSDDDWYTLSIHDLLSAFSWAGHYDHEGLSTTYSAATTPEGWQLVPKEPTEEMHRAARDWSIEKYGKAIGFEASHGCYKYMLAAAPKYMGDSNE